MILKIISQMIIKSQLSALSKHACCKVLPPQIVFFNMELLNPVLFHTDKCIVKHFQTTVMGISQINTKFSKFLVICKRRAWPVCSSY